MKEIEKAILLATDVQERLFDDGFYFPSPVSDEDLYSSKYGIWKFVLVGGAGCANPT